MFLFIAGKNGEEAITYLFKYISCSYLSYLYSGGVGRMLYLNTSHVLIYQIAKPPPKLPRVYLNTSHVLIYHNPKGKLLTLIYNLNTSHVLIYPTFLRTSCFL